MRIFDKYFENIYSHIYCNLFKVYNIYIISKLVNQVFSCEDKYTTQIDTILSAMQDDGYEIVDVKITVIQNQGLVGEMEGFNTLITYR